MAALNDYISLKGVPDKVPSNCLICVYTIEKTWSRQKKIKIK